MAASVTIDDLGADTLDRLQAEARRRGVDVGTVIKEMIRDGLGRRQDADPAPVHHDLDGLAGTWSAEEAAAFLDQMTEKRTDGDVRRETWDRLRALGDKNSL